MMAWLPHFDLSFPLNDFQDTTTSESLAAPGSTKKAHNTACAWFLGPKAENADYFKMFTEMILDDVVQCRRNFASEDEVGFRLSPPQDDLILTESAGLC
jgi:hypothetical protein